ncbi:hypothetical protein LEP1GSC133_0330 [Leptospira borgpetersenii serovar Pomona str. 200901868]|uniref:Uncharacterized protein n=1 Tax=Leptospira borgpetersenii serovar Pomona str. 200901868 TaxID=1192866 RepID=M6WFI9_LEPBO|nr:hypothetical protein LEP1GSC133_0330 [Leptospira borgpetersenii serovar Pomona str. 200901868]
MKCNFGIFLISQKLELELDLLQSLPFSVDQRRIFVLTEIFPV